MTLLTALLENLDLLYNLQLLKLHFCLKMPAQFLILMHAYYTQSYAGIIASSLFDIRLREMCGVTPYMEVTTARRGISLNVPLSHLKSKGKASAYILYCTGSGMLTRYTHCGQCNIKNIALTTVHISRYSIPKSPKNHHIPLMQPLTACLFI